MTEFESLDVRDRYYKTLKEYGVLHVNWPRGHIVTDKDIDELIMDLNGEVDLEIKRELFSEAP